MYSPIIRAYKMVRFHDNIQLPLTICIGVLFGMSLIFIGLELWPSAALNCVVLWAFICLGIMILNMVSRSVHLEHLIRFHNCRKALNDAKICVLFYKDDFAQDVASWTIEHLRRLGIECYHHDQYDKFIIVEDDTQSLTNRFQWGHCSQSKLALCLSRKRYDTENRSPDYAIGYDLVDKGAQSVLEQVLHRHVQCGDRSAEEIAQRIVRSIIEHTNVTVWATAAPRTPTP